MSMFKIVHDLTAHCLREWFESLIYSEKLRKRSICTKHHDNGAMLQNELSENVRAISSLN